MGVGGRPRRVSSRDLNRSVLAVPVSGNRSKCLQSPARIRSCVRRDCTLLLLTDDRESARRLYSTAAVTTLHCRPVDLGETLAILQRARWVDVGKIKRLGGLAAG